MSDDRCDFTQSCPLREQRSTARAGFILHGVVSPESVSREPRHRGPSATPVLAALMVQGSELRVQGVGFWDQGSGFKVQGSGCRVQGSEFRVQGAGCRVHDLGFGVRGSKRPLAARGGGGMILYEKGIISKKSGDEV